MQYSFGRAGMYRFVRFCFILSVFIMARCPGCVAQQTKFALLIANQQYNTGIQKLENPANDIKIVAQALETDGFHVDQIVDGTRPRMLRAIRELASKLNRSPPGSVGFLYYSGHGMAKPGTSDNYLIPTNVKRIDDEDVWDESVNIDDIQNILASIAPFSRFFVVIDACRAELDIPVKAPLVKTFAQQKDAKDMYLAFSTGWNHTATDWFGHENGPYAKALSQFLLIPGLTHREVFHRVKDKVSELTSNAQQPIEVDGMRGDFFFAGEAHSERTEEVPQPLSAGAYSQAAWDIIKDRTDAVVFERFATVFAGTPHEAEARERAEKLGTHEPEPAPPANRDKAIISRPVNIEVRSNWPSYRIGDNIILYVRANNIDQPSVKAFFEFGSHKNEENANYDSLSGEYIIRHQVSNDAVSGSYMVPIVIEDLKSKQQERTAVRIEIGVSRDEWTSTYLQPAPGQPALIPAETNSVVVASPDDNASLRVLKELCRKFPDVDFAMYTSVKRDQSNSRYQIEMAYNLSYNKAVSLKSYALERGISKDPYILTYKWDSHAENYWDCFWLKRVQNQKSRWPMAK